MFEIAWPHNITRRTAMVFNEFEISKNSEGGLYSKTAEKNPPFQFWVIIK